MYLVDTSVWIDFLRGTDVAHVTALTELLDSDELVGTAPVILQEILQGADSEERFRKWRGFFSDLWCYVPDHPVDTYVAAAQIAERLVSIVLLAWASRFPFESNVFDQAQT